jgi:hypothetical protein
MKFGITFKWTQHHYLSLLTIIIITVVGVHTLYDGRDTSCCAAMGIGKIAISFKIMFL